MTLIFLSHLDWGSPNYGCPDGSGVSMVAKKTVAEPNEPKCGDRYPYSGGIHTKLVDWTWFLCKATNTCIHEKSRLECFHLII